MTFFENGVTKELIGKALLVKNLPLPLFAKEGFISSLWQREDRRDFVIDVFLLMTLLVIQFCKVKNQEV